jgi:hypothetical protein
VVEGGSVGLVRQYLGTGRGSFPGRYKIFLFSTGSRSAVGPTQLPILWVSRAISPERETDHSPPSSAEVKNGGAISLPSHVSPWHVLN